MNELAKKKCVPCKSGTPPLTGEELKQFYCQLEQGWEIVDEKQIQKIYHFKDFKTALAFINYIGKIAEEEGHHPDLELSWGKVKVILSTHKINGLSESDFILASKCDVSFTAQENH